MSQNKKTPVQHCSNVFFKSNHVATTTSNQHLLQYKVFRREHCFLNHISLYMEKSCFSKCENIFNFNNMFQTKTQFLTLTNCILMFLHFMFFHKNQWLECCYFLRKSNDYQIMCLWLQPRRDYCNATKCCYFLGNINDYERICLWLQPHADFAALVQLTPKPDSPNPN